MNMSLEYWCDIAACCLFVLALAAISSTPQKPRLPDEPTWSDEENLP